MEDINQSRKLKILIELKKNFNDEEYCNEIFEHGENKYLCALLVHQLKKEDKTKKMFGNYLEFDENADKEYIDIKNDIYEKLKSIKLLNFPNNEFRVDYLVDKIQRLRELIHRK